jgi:hypothetical protein
MQPSPAVIVNKSGFWASLVKGVFGTIIVILLCTTALGIYAMSVFKSSATQFAEGVLSNLPEWSQALPPFPGHALNAHRALEYRDNLEIRTRLLPCGGRDDCRMVVVEIANKGDQVVSLATMHVTVEDKSDNPLLDLPIVAATPLQMGCELRGPIQPGQTRQIPNRVVRVVGEPKVGVELTDLWVWSGPPSDSGDIDDDDEAVTPPPHSALPLLPAPPSEPLPAPRAHHAAKAPAPSKADQAEESDSDAE